MKTVYLLLSSMCISLMALSQTATLPSGSGTQLDPYRIATLNNLYWIVAPGTVNGLTENDRMTKFYLQTANIDASATSTWESGAGWRPIGNSIGTTTRFSGNYHGQGYTISNLFINRPALGTVGFFGLVSTNAVINYVYLTNVSIAGKDQVGGLIGYIEGNATIGHCYTTGTVSAAAGNDRCGGLISIIAATCTVADCYSTCSVSANSNVGGLIGEVRAGSTISRCYATGTVQSAAGYAGGLIGYTESPVNNCYARGNLTCPSPFLVGGLVGYSSGGAITNCYATGSIPSGGSWLGGLTGYCSGATTGSYFDSQTAGTSTSHTGTAKTTAQMTNQTTFAGWDFTTVWHMTAENDGYPHLEWTNYVVLPVVMRQFNVKANGTRVQFNWETAQEMQSSYFDLQMSTDGKNWLSIHKVQAGGQSNSTLKYFFQYEEKVAGLHYYRIVMVDLDNKFTISNVVEVNIQAMNSDKLKINNPVVDGWMQVQLVKAASLQLYSGSGMLVGTYNLTAGNHRININALIPGVYMLRHADEVIKVVKQ